MKVFLPLFTTALFMFVAIDCRNINNGNYETLSATITRTSYGVPHIRAENIKSLGFGQGYAFASDGLCDLAEQIVNPTFAK